MVAVLLDEHELLTSLVQSGASTLFARQVQAALRTLADDQRALVVQLLYWIMGTCPPPVLLPTPPPPLTRSPHEAPSSMRASRVRGLGRRRAWRGAYARRRPRTRRARSQSGA